MSSQPQILKGLAELAVLSTLDDGAQYGVGILDRVRQEAGLNVAEGSIYPLLHRLERAGSVSAEWRLDGGQDRPRKYYSLTAAGRAELRSALDDWLRTSSALHAFVTRKANQ
ncbi:PadR family transcriptional regulator [Cognatilysobacter bugurensis]|uniref:Pex-like protein n=1 Tax=Cognatilysobacter bugurensis TaxID=543356 RepID=A0A918SY92_9GAMM|nr:helix-turn-helix transcriptional regulator [Lysobacter bugurensis]GHA76932.1 Pex-like protein [Lysobacter bugurensis]